MTAERLPSGCRAAAERLQCSCRVVAEWLQSAAPESDRSQGRRQSSTTAQPTAATAYTSRWCGLCSAQARVAR
eukprot:scaffold144531_cov301-Phaeocystis_antarctica.AAC.2